MDNMKALHNLYFSGDIAENWKKWKRWNLYALVSGAVEKDKSVQCVILLNTKNLLEKNLLTSIIHLFAQDEVNKIQPLIQKFDQYFAPNNCLFCFILAHKMDTHLTIF